ncbi:MAG: hypothetical protein GYA63_02305, partial [Armatimonadetes bacterium]|nr:hypothetical protein [Armatimonadota bacterium]
PSAWDDEKAVEEYLARLVPDAAKAIAQIVGAVRSGRLGLVGAGRDELLAAIEAEASERGTAALDPAIINAIIVLVTWIVRLLGGKPQ